MPLSRADAALFERPKQGVTPPHFSGGVYTALLGRSTTSIQKIELGHLPLSQSLAMEVMIQTDVDLGWLLEGDVGAPVIDRFGRPYTRVTFENAQANLKRPNYEPGDISNAHFSLAMALAQIASKVLGAYDANQTDLLFYKLTNAIRLIGKEMKLPMGDNDCPMQELGTILRANFGPGTTRSEPAPSRPHLEPILDAYGKRLAKLAAEKKRKAGRKLE